MDSMHIEMEREAQRQAEERAAASPPPPPPAPSYPEPPQHDPLNDSDVMNTPAATVATEEAQPNLDSTVEQAAAKVHITQVSDVIDPVRDETTTTSAEKVLLDCGLPQELVDDPSRISAYCVQHGVTQSMLHLIEYTGAERDCFEKYCSMLRSSGTRPIAKRHFTAALRMFKKNYPLTIAVLTDLNTIKYHG